MKIAVVGNYNWPHYQQALLEGFQACIESAESYPIVVRYFPVWNVLGILYNTIKIFASVVNNKPDAVFMYRVDYAFPIVLPLIKNLFGVKVLVYHNDDPYNNMSYRRRKHIYFLHSVKYADIAFVYREVNIDEALSLGAKQVKIMRSHYYTKLDTVSTLPIDFASKSNEIVFIGHFEPDDRVEYFDALFKHGINVHIYGHSDWKPVFEKHNWPIEHLHPAVFGKNYRLKLHEAYAALAFFSKKNRDDYTRRCFEIPMAGTLLIAPRTSFMEKTFCDGVNVVLFSSPEQLAMSLKNLLSLPNEVRRISENGLKFVMGGGFSEIDAAQNVINEIQKLL